MRTSRRFRFVVGFLAIVALAQISFSQTITSTATGGRWNATGTWIGNVVPTSGNDVVIAGTVVFNNGDGSCRNLTINAGAVLYNNNYYASPEMILTVSGSVTNNGTIRNNFGSGLALIVLGSITNNGTWTHNRTELGGSGTQTISMGAGKLFQTSFKVTSSSGTIVAGSDLSFAAGFDLNKRTFDMAAHGVTLNGEGANIYNGTVVNTRDINGKAVSGTSYPYLDNITYDGLPNIKGRVKIHTLVTMKGTLTVTDTLENLNGYSHPEKILKVVGNVINNGIIRNWFSYGLALNVTGNITNNGSWVHNRTELSGSADQVLSLGAGKSFEANFSVTDSVGYIVAGSNLVFTGQFNLNKNVFDAKSYALTLRGEGATIFGGIVMNTADLIGAKVGDYPIVDNIIYDGKINLKGLFRINSGTLRGDVTITDTIQNSSGYAHPEKILKIVGSLTNNGLVRNNFSYGLALDVTGNIKSTKAFANNRIQLGGSGSRTIDDRVSQLQYVSTGEKVTLVGENYLPNLSIAATSKCLLASGGGIYVPNNAIDETLDNWSVVTSTRKPSTSQLNVYFRTRVAVTPAGGFDSIKVSTYGHQVPPTFSNAVRTWWRIDKQPKTAATTLSTLTLYYSHAELGTNTETALQMYCSSDSGKSWRQVSTPLNMTRNIDQNYVTITDVPSTGDYVLSSSPDPMYVRPSVVVSTTGRTQIRVGPPNRYTVDYVNNSDVPTGDMLISLRTQGGVHIKQVEPSMPDGVKLQVIPIDSMWYGGQKDSCLLWVASMAPREERKFDVVLNADLSSAANPNSTADVKIAPLLVAAAWWVGEALVAAYVTDVAMNVTENIWRPVAPCETLGEAFKSIVYDSFKKANSDWFGRERPAKAVMDKAKDGLREKVGLTIPGEQLLDAANATMTGAQRYLKGDFKVKDCSGNQKSLGGDVSENNKSFQKVTSWDPNEKVGPSGFGADGFMSTAGKMTYQILFENKKEATAPAWKIVVVDTLQADFDPSTVEFGRTSHDGPAYQWVMTRNGNILTWSIEGIELPPNVTPPEGEGYVIFSVQPNSTIASGTRLKNRATITFDLNKPISTNEVVNTIDFTPPSTVMKALPTSATKSPLVVKWQSSDGTTGAGVKSVTVFASKDGAPFYTIGSSAVDSILVPVTNGDYRFYGLAVDNVGNVEAIRPSMSQIKVSSIVNVESRDVPIEFALDQNYPNPFNPTTTITYSLAAKVRASLKIFDVLGREVITLFDEEQAPGRHYANWDAGRYASGVYFYRLTAGEFVRTQKMVILK